MRLILALSVFTLTGCIDVEERRYDLTSSIQKIRFEEDKITCYTVGGVVYGGVAPAISCVKD